MVAEDESGELVLEISIAHFLDSFLHDLYCSFSQSVTRRVVWRSFVFDGIP